MNLSFIDDNVSLRSLSNAAFRHHFRAIAWLERKACRSVPKAIWRDFGAPATVKELTTSGLWLETDEAFEATHLIPGHPAQLEAQKAVTRERQVRHRERVKTNPTGDAEQTLTSRSALPEASQERPPSDLFASGPVTPALPSHTLPSPPPPLNSGSSVISGSSEPSSDLTGSPREAAKGRLPDRLLQPTAEAGVAPRPRHDPLGERISFASWFPSSAMLAWCKARGLTDAELDVTLIEARDGLTGRHEFDWFDAKVWKYIDVALLRKANPGGTRAGRVQASADWPTEDAARLREAIRSGQHGKALATKLEAGQLDYPLAQRLVRERQEAAVRRPDGQVGVPPPGDLSALLRGTTRAMP